MRLFFLIFLAMVSCDHQRTTQPHHIKDSLAYDIESIKIKQEVSGCFRTDGGADDFAKLHSIAETAMKNGNSKFNAILAVVQQ